MSIDDVEAAAQHQANQAKLMAESSAPHRASTGKLHEEPNNVHVDKVEPKQKHKPRAESNLTATETETISKESAKTDNADEVNNNRETQEQTVEFVPETVSIERTPKPQRRSRVATESPPRELKPLPNQRFRKKNAATEWEAVLQKRLTGEVKERELEQSVSQILATSSTNSVVAERKTLVPIEIDAIDGAKNVGTGNLSNALSEESCSSGHNKHSTEFLNDANKFGSLRRRTTTAAWLDALEGNVSTANPAYSYTKEIDDTAVINMTSAGKDRRQPKVRKTIAMFENINRDHMVPEPRYAKRSMSPGRGVSPGRGPSPARGLSPARGISPARSPRSNGHVIQAGIKPAVNGVTPASPGVQHRFSRGDIPYRTPQSSRGDLVSSHSTIVKVDTGYSSDKDDTQVFTIVNKVGNDIHDGNSVEDEQSVTVVEIARL